MYILIIIFAILLLLQIRKSLLFRCCEKQGVSNMTQRRIHLIIEFVHLIINFRFIWAFFLFFLFFILFFVLIYLILNYFVFVDQRICQILNHNGGPFFVLLFFQNMTHMLLSFLVVYFELKLLTQHRQNLIRFDLPLCFQNPLLHGF